jgi:hypothetical protein
MQASEDRPGPERDPADGGRAPAAEATAGASAWRTPAIAGAAAFVAVRLVRIGLAGKLLRTGFRLGRGRAGKLALSFAAKKMAQRKRA